jgi:ketosteroid isomerase-like protein
MRSYADTFKMLDAAALLAFLQPSADFRFIGDMTPATYDERRREASQQPFAAVRSGDVRFDSVLVNVLAPTVAVATGFAVGTWTLKSGAVHRLREVGTFVWVRDAGGWKLAHAQNVEREEPPSDLSDRYVTAVAARS